MSNVLGSELVAVLGRAMVSRTEMWDWAIVPNRRLPAIHVHLCLRHDDLAAATSSLLSPRVPPAFLLTLCIVEVKRVAS